MAIHKPSETMIRCTEMLRWRRDEADRLLMLVTTVSVYESVTAAERRPSSELHLSQWNDASTCQQTP